MSMVTRSAKRARVYRRAFDHDQAVEMHAQGWSYTALGEHFGVSMQAVRRVCDPVVRADMDRRAKEHLERARKPCLGGCGTRVWSHNRSWSGYCKTCAAARKAASNMRDTELRCTKCTEWKPDDLFGPGNNKVRRGRRAWCRACDSSARRANRLANKERDRTYDRQYKRRGKKMSKFVVLQREEDGRWAERARIDAASRMAAIERTADSEGNWAAVTEGQLRELAVQRTSVFKVSENGASAAA